MTTPLSSTATLLCSSFLQHHYHCIKESTVPKGASQTWMVLPTCQNWHGPPRSLQVQPSLHLPKQGSCAPTSQLERQSWGHGPSSLNRRPAEPLSPNLEPSLCPAPGQGLCPRPCSFWTAGLSSSVPCGPLCSWHSVSPFIPWRGRLPHPPGFLQQSRVGDLKHLTLPDRPLLLLPPVSSKSQHLPQAGAPLNPPWY